MFANGLIPSRAGEIPSARQLEMVYCEMCSVMFAVEVEDELE